MIAAPILPRGLPTFLRVVDGGMLIYWGFSAIACLGLIVPPSGMMYAGYGTPLIDAWNWSFAPIDVAFAVTGLWSLRLAARGDVAARPLALLSLTLTMCAGAMAISFWAISGDFDLAWWIPNLALALLPIIWLPSLICSPEAPVMSKDVA
ncbi:MAG: DUF5360 family protein [Alphaproteobacteria bacterium]|nr:DUF5360 family protein [Alphaproteobacteria bacterium]